MPKKKTDDYDDDDFEDEDDKIDEVEDEDEPEDIEFEEDTKKKTPNRRPTAKEKRHPKAAKPETDDRFQAFHMPERAGVLDKETNKPVLEDDLTFKAWVMNKLQKIEDAVC